MLEVYALVRQVILRGEVIILIEKPLSQRGCSSTLSTCQDMPLPSLPLFLPSLSLYTALVYTLKNYGGINPSNICHTNSVIYHTTATLVEMSYIIIQGGINFGGFVPLSVKCGSNKTHQTDCGYCMLNQQCIYSFNGTNSSCCKMALVGTETWHLTRYPSKLVTVATYKTIVYSCNSTRNCTTKNLKVSSRCVFERLNAKLQLI